MSKLNELEEKFKRFKEAAAKEKEEKKLKEKKLAAEIKQEKSKQKVKEKKELTHKFIVNSAYYFDFNEELYSLITDNKEHAEILKTDINEQIANKIKIGFFTKKDIVKDKNISDEINANTGEQFSSLNDSPIFKRLTEIQKQNLLDGKNISFIINNNPKRFSLVSYLDGKLTETIGEKYKDDEIWLAYQKDKEKFLSNNGIVY